MSDTTWQSRLGSFLRSVIPADPAQLLLLAGIVCLIFGSRMDWWPRHLGVTLTRLGSMDSPASQSDTYGLSVLGTCVMIFSALAGYYACFWPGTHPVRRVVSIVLLPATAGICFYFARFAYLGRSYTSRLDPGWFGNSIASGQLASWTASPGFRVTFAGLVFIGIFTIRLIRRHASLPLALPEASVTGPSDPELWRRTRFLIWLLVGPLFIAAAISAMGIAGILFTVSKNASEILRSPLFSHLCSILEAVIYFTIACWIAGKNGREVLRNSVNFTKAKYLLLGAAFAIGIAVFISSAHYLADRAHWAATEFGNVAQPQAGRYFNFPSPWLFLMFFDALFEEFVFRGLLQTIFVRRYSLYRGVLLTSIAWAAYHFNFDSSFAHFDELGVLRMLGFRFGICIALGFVLSWLTLRSGSILPGAIAHTLDNVFVSGFGISFSEEWLVRIFMWAVLAYLVFRYLPVEKSPGPMTDVSPMAASVKPESAV